MLYAIEVQSIPGGEWQDARLRVDAVDRDAAAAVARREYPNAAGVWAGVVSPAYAGGRIGIRFMSAHA